MKNSIIFCLFILSFVSWQSDAYERNKAVPVQKVLFGEVESVRQLVEQELITDQRSGWHTFGGALIGGAIGNQFGGGSGRTAATILGSLLGGSIARNRQPRSYVVKQQLVELLIKIENGEQYMIIQDYDSMMPFRRGDEVRMVYLGDNTVRVDKTF